MTMTENTAYTQYRIAVPAAFEAVFSHFYYAENNTAESITRTLLPSFQTIMVFSFTAGLRFVSQAETALPVDKCIVFGPVRQAFGYTLDPGAKMLVASFKDDAFYRFFGRSAPAVPLPIHPDTFLAENCFNGLWDHLQTLTSAEEQVEAILHFSAPYLKTRAKQSEYLVAFNDEAQSPIKALSRELQQSERSLQQQHKKFFGYSAKEINRYQRFIKAIHYLQEHRGVTDWFEIISTFGYYDQSQLIHDFKHYLNLSPGRYLKFQQDICG